MSLKFSITGIEGNVRRSKETQFFNDFFESSLSMYSNCRPSMAVWTYVNGLWLLVWSRCKIFDSFDIELSKLSGNLYVIDTMIDFCHSTSPMMSFMITD